MWNIRIILKVILYVCPFSFTEYFCIFPDQWHHFPIVTEPWIGSLRASFIAADWQVRVFWSSGLVDRPSGHMYVRTITLSGCMYILSHYILFSSQAWLAFHRKTCALSASPEELSPYNSPRRGSPGTWNYSYDWTAWGITQTKTVSSNNWEAYNLGVHSTLVTRFHCTQQLWDTGRAGFLNSPGDFGWLDLPRWDTAAFPG